MSETLAGPVRGMGFVPGVARGTLGRDPTTHGILLADDAVLHGLSASPAGCVLADAAPFAHASIGLLSRGIPTVILDREGAAQLQEGIELVLDGSRGYLWPTGTPESSLTPPPPALPAALYTRDGERVELRASVRSAAAVTRARERGVRKIGLVRTEFLVPEAGVRPDRDFYAGVFGELLDAAAGMPVNLRLLDLAPDKYPLWAAALPDTGPLGVHGSRLYRNPMVRGAVEAQLQGLAALDARDVGILLPNVDTVAQLREWRTTIGALLPDPGVRVGAMLETVGAALAIDAFLAEADMVGFGMNDLMQSLFAADRDMPDVRARLDPYAPALYRFLRLAAELAGSEVGRVQLCGMLPQLPGVMPVLLGLGYRTFSVDVAHAGYLARTVAGQSTAQARELAASVCAARSSQDVAGLLGVRCVA